MRETQRLMQRPAPGDQLVRHRGDVVEFSLDPGSVKGGAAWLRTNIGRAGVRRREIIGDAERGQPRLDRDWHDIPMRRSEGGTYLARLPLLQVGHFEAKTFFVADGDDDLLWPDGPNLHIKVEPAEHVCANTIYSAFVRQFGPARVHAQNSGSEAENAGLLEKAGYTVIPPSGKFRDLLRELDFIHGTLNFRILQLLPVHPTPTTYARMGRFGSPFATLDFMDVDPALAEFDRRTTPLDQFRELIDGVHQREGKIFMDLPINHTGWASWLQIQHPHWFARNHDRTFQSPGAWGVQWEDLSRLDYAHRGLWRYMADVFRFWCRQGIDGFRCDAGYMVPFRVWEYIAAKVRDDYPDTVFLLEGLGGKKETVEALLSGANLDWAYSELFQNYDQKQIDRYLPEAMRTSATKGLLVHFAETHDNNRLAATSACHARLRTAISALFSEAGGFGITNGVEWLATEKVDVHGAASLSWDNPVNLIDHVTRLNAILRSHAAFAAGAELRLIHQGQYNSVAMLRTSREGSQVVLVAANLSESRPALVSWPAALTPAGTQPSFDLITGQSVPLEAHGDRLSCPLQPAQVACVSWVAADVAMVGRAQSGTSPEPPRISRQALKAKALEIFLHYRGTEEIGETDADALADAWYRNPVAYCVELATGACHSDLSLPSPTVVTSWSWPRDTRRTVCLPAGNVLRIVARHRFTAALLDGDTVLRRENSIQQEAGPHVVLMLPLTDLSGPRRCVLAMTVYERGHCRRARSDILFLTPLEAARVGYSVERVALADSQACALCTNGRGAMTHTRAAWGRICSQYDAFLAANLHVSYPVDRRIMWTRCRAWLVYRDYSVEINERCQDAFTVCENQSLLWRFSIPAGMGRLVRMEARLAMVPGYNRVELSFARPAADANDELLGDGKIIRLIVRPDIENRSFHEPTKAYMGPEEEWPRAIVDSADGLIFAPAPDARLEMRCSNGVYSPEPEWSYMVPHPLELGRGLDDRSDLFSPGYFTFELGGGDSGRIVGTAVTAGEETPDARGAPDGDPLPAADLASAANRALDAYVVKRDQSRTVIAGYPWFLDWGRDTLICLRGLIAAGRLDEAQDILRQFGRFESGGTLPNMIRGNDDSNRDTSDAPLWFFTACADLVRARGNRECLDADCAGRTLRDVLISIARGYMAGTANGIRMDPESRLVFSPAHFTWMDTNHPAGTPREGYPIEIQALWHAALVFLGEIDSGSTWMDVAGKARASILEFFLPTPGPDTDAFYMADCLHGSPGTPASHATADDALRPNQLLAVTLGAVTDRDTCTAILCACEELLVPGAIRSLADRPVRYAQPIHYHDRPLNDPAQPYWGRYEGDEDTRRKPAYHNGTAWTWLMPSYCEALFLAGGPACRQPCLSLLTSSAGLLESGCIGHVPEILDGNAPHVQRGCGAQAWGATELYRVIKLLGNA